MNLIPLVMALPGSAALLGLLGLLGLLCFGFMSLAGVPRGTNRFQDARCMLHGEIEACSGHFLNPCMSDLNSGVVWC